MQLYNLYICSIFKNSLILSTSCESDSKKNDKLPVQNPVQLPVKLPLENPGKRPVQNLFPAKQNRMETRSQYRLRKIQESRKTSG